MSCTEELLKLAEAATPGPWRADGEHGYIDCVCTKTFCIASDIEKEDAAFIAAANPETIKQLVELCRLMKTPLLYLHKLRSEEDATYTGSALEADVKKAIAAFNKFEGGE